MSSKIRAVEMVQQVKAFVVQALRPMFDTQNPWKELIPQSSVPIFTHQWHAHCGMCTHIHIHAIFFLLTKCNNINSINEVLKKQSL